MTNDANIYETKLKITGSLCDSYGNVKISSLIERLVDLTGVQTDMWEEMCDFPQDKTNICWIINRYDVKIYSIPVYLSEVKLQTYQSRYTKHFCERIFAVYDMMDNLLIRIVSYWSLRDFKGMKIVSVPGEYEQFTFTQGIREKTDKKMSRNPEYTHSTAVYIRSDDFDVNMHVNNARYFSFLYECDDIINYNEHTLSEVLVSYVGGINDKTGNEMLYCKEDIGQYAKLSQKITCADGSTACLMESYWRKN